MKHRIPNRVERATLPPAEVDAILRRAYARRDAALAHAICLAFRGLAAALQRFGRAIDEARRLRALAMLDDHWLAALGLARADLPGIVYGWSAMGEAAPLPVPDLESPPPPSDRRQAA